jgi:hypothetical protein
MALKSVVVFLLFRLSLFRFVCSIFAFYALTGENAISNSEYNTQTSSAADFKKTLIITGNEHVCPHFLEVINRI